tara:strand:+ start:2557 stop:3396 length:840 start_codon:yes stop_codon:yes gene_type:complete
MKVLDTLVGDIYDTISPLNNNKSLNIPEDLIENFGEGIKDALRHWSKAQPDRKETLRMSNIGLPTRKLWYNKKYPNTKSTAEKNLPIRFLYGHMLEELLLFLIKLSGHTVTDEQKEVTLNGVTGHIDCKIDGEVIDIKSASSFGFKKFVDNSLADDDPFGYLAQLAGYEESEGTENGGFLVINKESGELCLSMPDDLDKPVSSVLIDSLRAALSSEEIPEQCYPEEPEGKSGNMKLARGCFYCHHKFKCYEELRTFKYARGLVYLTKVMNTPKVEEVWL